MRRRTISLIIAAAVLLTLGIFFVLRFKAPPEAARLLPESDAIVYVRLKDVRSSLKLDQSPVSPGPDLARFIAATGIVPERDLDAAAFAIHQLPKPYGPNGPVAYSEVFVGRFDMQKLGAYLVSLGATTEEYAGRSIYALPIDGRTLRVTQLGYDTLAASNMPTTEQIHSMLDRYHAAASPFSGSSLLAARYGEVPLLAQAWGIGHVGLPFAEQGRISVLGLELPVPADSDLVASIGYSGTSHVLSGGAVELRVTEIAPDDATAQRTVRSISSVLDLARMLQQTDPPKTPSAAAIARLLDSAALTQHGNRATLTATATFDDLRALSATTKADMPAPAAPAH